MTDGRGQDDKAKKPYLDPTSSFPPPGAEPERILEQVAARVAARQAARQALPAGSFDFEPPESAETLTHTHRLVALLFACGAEATEIGLELGGTAEEVDLLERNLLIEEQVRAYKERFWSSDASAQFRSLVPQAMKAVRSALQGEGAALSKEQLQSAYWLLEKATGKATQQLNVTDTTNLSHFMDEMKRLQASRAAPAPAGGLNPGAPERDVTPKAERPYQKYMRDWKKQQEGGT